MFTSQLPAVARDFFDLIESLSIPAPSIAQYKNTGLKLFNRPHNLYTNVDKKTGEVKSYVISTVYTPFSKDDISVKTKNTSMGKRLVISIEKIEKEDEAPENTDISATVAESEEKPSTELVCEYRGISAKSLRYEFPLPDRVDAKGITVKAEDGILTIILPVNKQNDDEMSIPVN